MTINKKLGLSLVAAAMLSTSAMADTGTITGIDGGTTSVGTISKERLTVADLNVSVAAFIFTPKFSEPEVRNNPVFEFDFLPATVAGDLTGYHIYEINSTNEYNGSDPITNDAVINAGKVTFANKTGAVVKSGSKYAILKDGESNASLVANYGQLLVEIAKKDFTGAEATAVTANVYTGDTGDHLSDAEKSPLYNVVTEYAIDVVKKFDRKTNLCSGRIVFDTSVGGCSADNNITDTITFDIVRTDVTYDFNTSVAGWSKMIITGDDNLTSVRTSTNGVYINTSADTIAGTVVAPTGSGSFEQNTTFTEAQMLAMSESTTRTLSLAYDLNASGIVPDQKFGWEFQLNGPDGNTTALGSDSFGTVASAAAGEWKTYGYSAQIPNVTANPANSIETTVIITNTGSEQEVFFNLIASGDTCEVSSVNDGLAKLAKNATTKYDASDLIKLCTDKGALSADTTTVGVEIDTTATPTDIYSAASFRNSSTATKVFKDLPVYSTSSMTN